MNKSMRILLMVFSCLIFVATAFAEDSLVAKHECGYYVAGQNLGVRNQITYSGNVTAIGIRVALPKGWTYVAVYGESAPDVKPQAGARDTFEFAWIAPPASPFSLTYEVLAPEGESGIKEIVATVLYRRLGGEQAETAQPNPLVVEQK